MATKTALAPTPAPLEYHVDHTLGEVTIAVQAGVIHLDESDLIAMLADLQDDIFTLAECAGL